MVIKKSKSEVKFYDFKTYVKDKIIEKQNDIWSFREIPAKFYKIKENNQAKELSIELNAIKESITVGNTETEITYYQEEKPNLEVGEKETKSSKGNFKSWSTVLSEAKGQGYTVQNQASLNLLGKIYEDWRKDYLAEIEITNIGYEGSEEDFARELLKTVFSDDKIRKIMTHKADELKKRSPWNLSEKDVEFIELVNELENNQQQWTFLKLNWKQWAIGASVFIVAVFSLIWIFKKIFKQDI